MADTIRTEADLLNNIFPDNQAPGSITAQDMRDLIKSTRYLQPLGWEFKYDATYTSGSPLPLVDYTGAGSPVQVTFSTNPGQDLRYPSTFPDIWDDTSQKLKIPPAFQNGFGIVRFSCKALSPNAVNTHLELLVDIGSDPVSLGGVDSNLIYEDSSLFAKGNNVEQYFNWVVPFFGGPDFVNNGAAFILQSHSGDASVWQMTLTAGAIFIPNPAGEG